jgi:hypothetical protein
LLNLTARVRVAVIDVAGPLADLDCGRAGQPPYTAAWILVCQAGRPLGSIEIALRDPVISAAELEREVRGQLGDGWDRGPRATPEPPPLSRASVVVPANFAREAELRRCVKRLGELDHPDYEVIVADNRPVGAPPADIEGAPFSAVVIIYATLVWLDQRVWLPAGFQAVAGILLLAMALVLLPKLGLTAVGWAHLGTQAALAAAVTPFTVRHIRRAEFRRASQ